jgi:hypothetical protein
LNRFGQCNQWLIVALAPNSGNDGKLSQDVTINKPCVRKRRIELAVGEQPSVGGDLAAEEFELQAAVELESQFVVLAVTGWVLLSFWHGGRVNHRFSRV